METKNDTLNKWIEELEKDLKNSNLLNFDTQNDEVLKIMNDDFISLFNNALEGNTFKICKLDNFLSLSQAISTYGEKNKIYGNEIFTSSSKEPQQLSLKKIKEKSDKEIETHSLTNAYLCFGLMRYTLDVFAAASKQAPLVFIPIILTYDKTTDTYSFKGIKGEVYINNLLIERIKKVRRIDLSYPINSSFSLGEFLYYISVKIQPLNWNIINQVFISNFDLYSYDNYLSIKNEQETIISHDIIRRISYFNSQFYALKNNKRVRLDSKFLSVIDMDNDEYDILRKVSARDNLFIRTNDENAKIHLLSNIILSYALNNLKTLVIYGSDKEKNKLLSYIDNEGYSKFVCDINPLSLDKNNLLADIVNYDNYLLPYRKAKENMVSDDLQKYYDYKNQYKKLTNSLRTKNNALNFSINQLINEYYQLDSYPLINITFNEPDKFTEAEFRRQFEFVKSFATTLHKLNCKLENHPFYGFKHSFMRKDNFIELRDNITLISSRIRDIKTLLDLGKKKYSYPHPKNLFEYKALLNILTFIDNYKDNKEWISDEEIRNKYIELISIRDRINASNKERKRLIQHHRRNVLFVKEELVNEYLETKSSKLKTKIRKLLGGKDVPLTNIDRIVSSLDAYYKEINKIKEDSSKFTPELIDLMRNGNLDVLDNAINEIILFKKSLNSIEEKNDFDVLTILNDKDTNRLIHRKALQNAYNMLLEAVKKVKAYFDENIYNFETMSFDKMENKATSIATNFSSINDYLDFYKKLIETNELIYNLGNELIKYSPEDFGRIFLKRFYYDLINERIRSNPLLKNHTRNKIYEELSNFYSSDTKRKGMIDNIISTNIDTYLKRNLIRLKNEESSSIYNLFEKGLKHIDLNYITENVKESLSHTKLCVFSPYKSVAKYLSNPIYKFDLILIIGESNMKMIDVLPSLAKGNNIIVFDEEYISSDPRKNVISQETLDNKLLSNARIAYNITTYSSDKRNIIAQNSPLDESLKKHIANELVKHGFEINIDYQIKNYIIDILVRVPNAKNIIAIELNHLPYNSPEDAYSSFELEDRILSNLGFIPYRIFTSSFFFNEESEMVELIDFIVKKSNIISSPKIVKKEILLMDYLFEEYKDPRVIYFQLDKNNMSLKDIVITMIEKCAPISIKELELIVKENIKDILKRLVKDDFITLEDKFIFIKGKATTFRRINREEAFFRPLDTVSKRELYDAIYKIINHLSSIDQETLIKMILLSLGYKKMKKEDYDTLIECIEFLLKSKIIFNDGTTLYRDIEIEQ